MRYHTMPHGVLVDFTQAEGVRPPSESWGSSVGVRWASPGYAPSI